MHYVCNEESLGVSFVRGNSDGAASTGWVHGCVVHAHIYGIVVVADKSTALCCAWGCKFDEAVGWVGVGKEGEVFEEVGMVVCVFECIGRVCDACKANDGCAEAREKG